MIFPGVYIRINFTRGSGFVIVYPVALYSVCLLVSCCCCRFFSFLSGNYVFFCICCVRLKLCRLELFICSRICLHGTRTTAKHHSRNAHALSAYVSSAASFAPLNFVQLKYDTNGNLLFSLWCDFQAIHHSIKLLAFDLRSVAAAVWFVCDDAESFTF